MIEQQAISRQGYMQRSYGIVHDYMEILNTWGLWMQRARLDSILGWKKDVLWLIEPKLGLAASHVVIFIPQIVLCANQGGHYFGKCNLFE